MAFNCFCRRNAGFIKRTPRGVLLVALAVAVASAWAPAWAGGVPATVHVLYPAALASTLQKGIGPAFEKATGYRFVGHHLPASEVASGVLDKTQTADVLICANPRDNLKLIGLPGGAGLDWYLMFMQSPLVVAYGKKSRFANQLSAKPWYDVAVASGFRLGVTDPNTDPEGQLMAEALHRVVKGRSKGDAARKLAANSLIVPVQDRVQRLKSNHIDATFFYETQAIAADIPSISLDQGSVSTTYTATVLNHASKPKAASAFVAFLLGAQGQKLLGQNKGVVVMSHPVIFGNLQAVPKTVQAALRKRLEEAD